MLKKFEDIYNACRKSGGILHITADESSLKILLPLIQDFAKKSQITKLLTSIQNKAVSDTPLDEVMTPTY